ncbi:hypothetical protein SUDANB58_03229 [Streptomyces sp. enrichment culture]|uniref:hypothetical protein n=1 Tax=Streptomyces sp. enrichment culture TaxID=1795815 RepID=UPI003F55A8D2
MAFGVEELRVLRRALVLALRPSPISAEDVQNCIRLAESLDEATRESARLRAFLVADLARYRAALPGTAAGYLTLLDEALGAGHHPTPDDLAALRALRGNPAAAALLARCQSPAGQDPRPRPATSPSRLAIPAPAAPNASETSAPAPTVPASRTRLLALPGGLRHAGPDPTAKPEGEPAQKPAPRPAPAAPEPDPDTRRRPVPTPGEVFPRRKPAPPPAGAAHRLAAG